MPHVKRFSNKKFPEPYHPIVSCLTHQPTLKDSQMYIRALAFLLFLTQVVLAQQPTPIVPDPKLTPGDTFDVSAQDLCVPGYAKKVRNVPEEVRRQVYREYGIISHGRGDYEVDHLISLELGGSNSIKNLWPESYRTSPWNAGVKDRLEDKLYQLVCSGQLGLKTAQQAIASNSDRSLPEVCQSESAWNGAGLPPCFWACGHIRQGLGEYKEREVLEAGIAVLWRNKAG
jgi:hypothetical protein